MHNYLIETFNKVLENAYATPLAQIFDLKNEAELFFLCETSQIQDPFRFRGVRRSLALAHFIVNEKGNCDREKIQFLIRELEKEGEIFYPGGYNDWEMRKHFLNILHETQDEAFFRLMNRVQIPLCHSKAESLIRDTLSLNPETVLTNSHVRIAVLSALFCPLRQNVGSCFATAPAILIHEEQNHQFLEDLQELLLTGKLKRTFGGIEYAVPMSPSSGSGDLKKNIFSYSTKERILFSPGLFIALTKIGLIDAELPLQGKIEKMELLCLPHLEKKERMNVEDLIKDVLLDYFNLSEEDFREFENFEKKFFKLGQIVTVKSAKKTASLQHVAELFQRVLSHFKSFADHLLLKTWEFTLASFVDVKTEFSRWNLYSSLGLHPEEKDGIGQIIYLYLDVKLREANEKIQSFQAEYEMAYDHVQATQRLLKNAGSEAEAKRLQAEHQSRIYHMQICLEMRDKNQINAQNYAQFFPFIIGKYQAKFPEYFQEIYDADMQNVVSTGMYDDAPAGFRLMYKHGRTDPGAWSFIHNKEEYASSLRNFFLMVEQQIAAECEWEEGKKAITELTTAIVQHIRSEEFIKSAFMRMAKAHHLPFRDATYEKAEAKPWSYISGGTINTLLRTYFRRENTLSEEARWVESPMDLLIFMIDVLKMAPVADKRVLVTSPTHAFSLLPSQKMLKEAWEDRGFTYTWVRDRAFLPQKQFYEQIRLSGDEQIFLIEKFLETLPMRFRTLPHYFDQEMTVKDFRGAFLQELGANSLFLATELDGFLYSMLPLTSGFEVKNSLEYLLKDWHIDETAIENTSKIMGAIELRSSALATILLSHKTVFNKEDVFHKLLARAQQLGLAPPPCVLVADTNWSERECYFAFLVNPGTSELELWRVDRTGNLGKPMHMWQRYINGTDKQSWTIYYNPQEYYL